VPLDSRPIHLMPEVSEVLPFLSLRLAVWANTRTAADDSFVRFHFALGSPATKFAPSDLVLPECFANALQHEPCRFLRNAKQPRQLAGANPVLAVNQHPKEHARHQEYQLKMQAFIAD
jgi:hypothetical protein